jgi:hypothetical protein
MSNFINGVQDRHSFFYATICMSCIQNTNNHALSGIQTHDPSNQADKDLRLKRRDYGINMKPYSKQSTPIRLASSLNGIKPNLFASLRTLMLY